MNMMKVDAPRFAPTAPPLTLGEGNTFVRLITAQVLAKLRNQPVADIVRQVWPSDLVIRAATAPAMTTVAGWAAELVTHTVADGLKAMGPASAAAQILQQGLVLNFNGHGTIGVPGLVADIGGATECWVAEGNPIPVRGFNLTPKTLLPHKLAVIAVLTREMIESSNAEALFRDCLMKAAGRIVDEVLFDANPGDAARPPGLRYGVTPTTPSNNSDAYGAAMEDFGALINELAPVGGAGPYIFVASPGRAALLGVHTGGKVGNVQIIGSSAVINDLLAIAPEALAVAASPEPQIEIAEAATLHMEDTSPQAVGSAAPHRSMFQTNSVAVKMRWPLTWALRDPRGFAWMTPVWKAPVS